MKPAEEVIPGVLHTRIGENHPDADAVNVVRVDGLEGRMIIRAELDEVDRQRIAAGGSVYLHVLTYGQPLQPFCLTTERPIVEVLTADGFSVREGPR